MGDLYFVKGSVAGYAPPSSAKPAPPDADSQTAASEAPEVGREYVHTLLGPVTVEKLTKTLVYVSDPAGETHKVKLAEWPEQLAGACEEAGAGASAEQTGE